MLCTPVPARRPPLRILIAIIVSEFAGTSLWFAGNAVLPDLNRDWGLPAGAIGYVTSAVQLGFIAGTLAFAFLMISDRFSPRRVFFICSLAGAAANALIVTGGRSVEGLLLSRFLTGVCLAGIYPVGMKIASGWYERGLGTALGFLVGALVLGTSLPHLLRSMGGVFAWENVTLAVSALAAGGGVLMFLAVPDGPYLVTGARFSPRAIGTIFHSRELRSAAFGYFGHMWELYAFYAFVPFLIEARSASSGADLDVPFWSFCVIAAGGLGCAAGGIAARLAGSAPVAFLQLCLSGCLCLLSPLTFGAPVGLFLALLVVWGAAVVGDSPQFSALIARHSPKELVGSALTIGNSIGFAITILSIQLVSELSRGLPARMLFLVLAPGPVFGLFSAWPLVRRRAKAANAA